jgi:hypothetical protein
VNQAPTSSNQSNPWPPLWGSDDHREWLARRLERNLRFRRQQDAFAALGEFMHRRAAREIIGGRKAVA